MTAGLFPSPYAATSLREYFAIGFEHYYLKDRKVLKRDCPVLYNKLAELEFPED
jgi:Mlc titration factor MtfA (ptsG expression regulator)